MLSRVVGRLIEPILADAGPTETAAARMQQIGVLTVILALEDDESPVTAARVAAVTGLAQSHVHKHLQKLVGIGIVERTAIRTPHGRGRAWRLSINHPR
jgi:predicted ArsR family transcriptional regulator